MKKNVANLGIFLLTALFLVNLPGAGTAEETAPDTGSEERALSEMKSIPVEVPAFVDRVRLSGRVQALWKIWGEHDDSRWGGVGLGDILEDEGFRVPRWRFGVSADLFEHVIMEVSMGESEFRREHDVNLLEAKITLDYLDYANLAVGAAKLPVGRQHMTSSRNMEFIFRPVLVEQMVVPKLGPDPKDFNPEDANGMGIPAYDVGITLFGRLLEGVFKYYAGMYNGTGEYFRGVTNYEDDSDFLEIMSDYCYTLRAVVNPLGDFPDVEGDFDREFKVSLGASGFFNDVSLTKDFDNRYTGWGIDGEIKGYGLSIRGEYLVSEQKLSFLSDELESTKRRGFYVQGGYFLWPSRLEAVYRYEQFDDNSHLDDNGDIKYHTVGVNFFVKGDHNYKVQVNYLIREEDGPRIHNDGLYAMLQVGF